MNYLLIIAVIFVFLFIISWIVSEYYILRLKISMAKHQVVKYQLFIEEVRIALQKNDLSIIADFDPNDKIQTSLIREVKKAMYILTNSE